MSSVRAAEVLWLAQEEGSERSAALDSALRRESCQEVERAAPTDRPSVVRPSDGGASQPRESR